MDTKYALKKNIKLLPALNIQKNFVLMMQLILMMSKFLLLYIASMYIKLNKYLMITLYISNSYKLIKILNKIF